ncbi:beta-lactamase-like protein [Naematelia encephala]|uniref:Beta-lactamase-like protein n=1 Tax=Naematelia encephala TaxID=71784 RepID=A0A1Y2B3K9_9TREE|nr:beta-lactamase-like protein [Naematelia encephala]
MSDTYSQDDPRLRPIPLSAYPWHPLPSPASKEAIVKVSLIPTSTLTAPSKVFTSFAGEEDKCEAPCWSFLIEKGDEAILWDMGLRQDPENSPDSIVNGALKKFIPHPAPGPISRLVQHGYDVSKIKLVIFSHEHFDRTGDLDTLPSPSPPILLGPGSIESISPGHPQDPNAAWPSTWLKKYHFTELPDPNSIKAAPFESELADLEPKGSKTRMYQPVGCFDHGVDWFGDGSLWIIDAPGHCAGHIMALCRVTVDPSTYILLGGDASHSQDLYLPVPSSPDFPTDPRSPIPVINGKPQLATDPKLATYTIGQLSRMSAEDNVMVLLAHEGEVEGVVKTYPDDLAGWKVGGWKEEKERDVRARAEKRVKEVR